MFQLGVGRHSEVRGRAWDGLLGWAGQWGAARWLDGEMVG